MIYTMIVAWTLTWFDLDDIFVEAINQIFNTNYTVAIYWLLFLIIGLIVMLIKE